MLKIIMILNIFFINKIMATVILEEDVLNICHHYKNKKEFYNFKDNCVIIASIVRAESSFKVESYNPEKSGSYGLMQIQCSTAKHMGLKYSCEQLFDPKINIRFGMKYLAWLRKNRKIKSVQDLIASWNAGAPYICKKININISSQVLCYPGEYINYNYVMKVFRRYRYLMKKYDFKKIQISQKTNYVSCYYKCAFNNSCIKEKCKNFIQNRGLK